MPDKSGPIPASELLRRLAARQATSQKKKQPFPPVIPDHGPVISGVFKGHGAGSRPPDLGRASYFVDLLTLQGGRIRLWGTDLKRAIAESETLPKLDTIIGVQRIGHQKVKVPRKDGSHQSDEYKRTRWRVERIAFYAEHALKAARARNAKIEDRKPNPTTLIPQSIAAGMAKALAFADRHIHNPRDREAFLSRVKDNLKYPDSIFRASDKDPPAR